MDYGTAVSQKGYDVKTCADRFLVYSSKFQTLKVYATYSVSTTIPLEDAADNTITINHNLGFFAPFVVMYNGSSTDGVGNSYFFTEGQFRPISYGSGYGEIKNTINTLTISVSDIFNAVGATLATGDTVYFTVYLFLNDFSTISHSEANTGTDSGASSTDYGIRVSKDGYDVKTTDDINCVFSSSFFNNIIDQVGIYTSVSGEDTIDISDQGYIPQALVYIQFSGDDAIYFAVGQVALSFGIKSNQLFIPMEIGDKAYYIIFKGQLDG